MADLSIIQEPLVYLIGELFMSPNRRTVPIWSSSRNVRPYTTLCVCILSPSNVIFLGLSLALRWQDQPDSSPLAGSTRQQTIGRINQVADRGDKDEDKDKDEDEDEISSYAALLTASIKRFSVSRM